MPSPAIGRRQAVRFVSDLEPPGCREISIKYKAKQCLGQLIYPDVPARFAWITYPNVVLTS